MVITLIGHSGCGKSHLAKRLEIERAFTRFSGDDLIEKKLASELGPLGLSSTEGLAEWMGQPYEQRFAENQKKYLAKEREVMLEIIHYVQFEVDHRRQDVVIDTSGSVVYTGEDILEALKEHTRIIYIAIPESEYDFMFKQYLSDPKPVIWGEMFAVKPEESEREALMRCYPELVRHRSKLYSKWADATMMIGRQYRDNYSVNKLLQFAGAVSK